MTTQRSASLSCRRTITGNGELLLDVLPRYVKLSLSPSRRVTSVIANTSMLCRQIPRWAIRASPGRQRERGSGGLTSVLGECRDTSDLLLPIGSTDGQQRGETDFFSGEPLRALSTLVFSDNVDLQRSASLTFAEITERGKITIAQCREDSRAVFHIFKTMSWQSKQWDGIEDYRSRLSRPQPCSRRLPDVILTILMCSANFIEQTFAKSTETRWNLSCSSSRVPT